MNPLSQVLEKEEELHRLAIDGENTVRYFNENPEKKKEVINRYNKLREEIVELSIPASYKENMLGSINRYLDKLNPNSVTPSSGNKSEALLYGFIGMVVGVVLAKGFDKFMERIEHEISDGVIKGIYRGGMENG